jgi:hypothetical protein
MDTLTTALVVVLLTAAMGGHIAVLIAFKYRGDALLKPLRPPARHDLAQPDTAPATAEIAQGLGAAR